MIYIIGGGALGITLAHRIHLVYSDTKLVVRSARIREAINSRRFLFLTRGRETVKVPALSPDEALQGSPRIIVVAVKAYHVPEVAQFYEKLLRKAELVVGLQNGIGAQEIFQKATSPAKIAVFVTSEGATRSGLSVRHFPGHMSYLGYLKKRSDGRLKNFADVLNKAGIKTICVDDIEPYRWAKLIFNSVINPITAVLRCRNGEILRSPRLLKIAHRLLEEGLKVVKELGIHLPFEDPEKELSIILRNTAQNRSSMLQDIESKRKTEIDFINGVLLERAQELQLNLPTHWVFYNLVKFLEGNA